MDASGAAGSGYAAVPVRRKSRKKTVDRKASKGRKIKYVTHPKMQNFMFPQVRGSDVLLLLGRGASCGFWNVGVAGRDQDPRPACLPSVTTSLHIETNVTPNLLKLCLRPWL